MGHEAQASPSLFGDPHSIATLDGPALEDGRIDTDITPILPDRRAQNAAILRQLVLCKGRHDTAAAGSCDLQRHVDADRHCVADPSLFDKTALLCRHFHHDVRPEARQVPGVMPVMRLKARLKAASDS